MKGSDPGLGRALDNPDPAIRLYLFYGPDDAQSRAHAARLERALGAEVERIDLEGPVLRDDPARLADEAAAISLFGGARIVRVIGGDECANAVAALLEAPAAGNPVAFIAGILKGTNALLKLVAGRRDVLAVQSYKPEGASLAELTVMLGRTHGLRLARDVAARLAANALGDRAIIEQEIVKLALFLDAAPDQPREADAAALEAIGAGLDEADTSALVDAIMDGRPDALAAELAALDEGGTGPIPVLRGLARRLLVLARLRAEVDAGKRPASVTANMGKALFYKDKPAVERQLARWPAERLRTVATRVFAVEAAIKMPGTAGEVLAAAEMIAIARVAERLR